MSVPLAALERVSFAWPGSPAPALRNESWHVTPGSLSVVIGRSGSGKSSLLRCLNGLVPHFSGGSFAGSVMIGGRDTRRISPRDLGQVVGFVFQDPESQMLTDRVESEVAFALEQAGVDRVTMRGRVDRALEAAGIGHLASRRPSELSGGERQRVAIAAALATRPGLLVLDEPTSQLDGEGAGHIMQAIASIRDSDELAIVVAEHRLEHLLGSADVLKVMGDGAITSAPRLVANQIGPHPLPAVTRLARELGQLPLPLTLDEARVAFADLVLPESAPARPGETGDLLSRLEGVDVARGGRPVLRDAGIEIREGEIVALMGRNGSGKTTLMRVVAGLLPVTAGSVHTLGHDMRRIHPAELGGRVGYVPQQATAIFMRERLDQEFEGAAAGRMRESLEAFGLTGFGARHPTDLSGGERERAALAVTMARVPRLLLLDEPTRGMDAWRKRDLACHLERIRQTGAGIVLASHDADLIAACATRVVVLENGRVIADGAPGDVMPGHAVTATQLNQALGGAWLTVDQVISALGQRVAYGAGVAGIGSTASAM